MLSEFKAATLSIAEEISRGTEEHMLMAEYMNILEKHIPFAYVEIKDRGWVKTKEIVIAPAWEAKACGVDKADWLIKYLEYGPDNLTVKEAKLALEELSKNRIQKIAWMALWYEIRSNQNALIAIREFKTSYGVLRHTANHLGDYTCHDTRNDIARSWMNIHSRKVGTEAYKNAIAQYQNEVNKIKRRINLFEDKGTGLIDLFSKQPTDPIDPVYFKSLFDQMPKNSLCSRTWGFELEIADAKGVNPIFGIEKGDDGSLRSYEADTDCECDCDDCRYHDCNCDYCENNNPDPDHCQSRHCTNADSAEFRSVRGISRCKHAGLIKLCDLLKTEDAEVNDTCGLHIHVYAADLQPKQIGHVLACYKWIEQMIKPICERWDTEYARELTIREVNEGISHGKISNTKMKAVNTTHLNSDRGTLEFRQMEGTYDYKMITVWAWLVRGLVTCASRGMEIKDFINVKSLDDIERVLGKFKYYLDDESPDKLIPGGQQDNRFIVRNTYKLSDRV